MTEYTFIFRINKLYYKKKGRDDMKTYTADKTCVNILRAVALLVLAGIIVATTYLRPFPIVMTILLAVFSALCLFGGGIWLPL